jgi:hypothetical protein
VQVHGDFCRPEPQRGRAPRRHPHPDPSQAANADKIQPQEAVEEGAHVDGRRCGDAEEVRRGQGQGDSRQDAGKRLKVKVLRRPARSLKNNDKDASLEEEKVFSVSRC